MRRILVFNRADAFLFELDPDTVAAAVVTEEVNGVNSIDISTTQPLAKTNRVLFCDHMGYWHEYVIINDDSEHSSGRCAYGSYHGVWSMQYDLSTVYADDVEVGGETPASASTAMTSVLDGTGRWAKGTINATGTATIEMFGNSAWERLKQVTEAYKAEVYQSVTVGVSRVTGRAINVVQRMGTDLPTRRFEWGRDVTSIRRKTAESPLCCRIIPIGKSNDVTIEDVNGGRRYIEDSEAAQAYRMPNGSGGWEYPTCKVKFDIDDDRELLDYATAHLHEYTRPVPTYEASVLQYAQAGMDYTGIAIGDTVQIVDRGFSEDVPLRLEGRVRKMVTNLLDETDVAVTIGDVGAGLSASLRGIDSAIEGIRSRMDGILDGSIQGYIENLTTALNNYINALGGYTYIVPGRGIVTYSVAVSDPDEGTEAKQAVAQNNGSVVEIRGGSIRIANSLTSGGDWEWKTVFTSGVIAASLITANNILAGTMSADRVRGGTLYAGGSTTNKYGTIKVMNQNDVLQIQLGYTGLTFYDNTGANPLVIGQTTETFPYHTSSTGQYMRVDKKGIRLTSSQALVFPSSSTSQTEETARYYTSMWTEKITCNAIDAIGDRLTSVQRGGGYSTYANRVLCSTIDTRNSTTGAGSGDVFTDNLHVNGSSITGGSKSRKVGTSYGNRLLYCLETPTPTFSDIGTARIGEDGICVVSIDDVYSETVSSTSRYVPFIQPLGGTEASVTETAPTHFIVEGTPDGEFAWLVLSPQRGYEQNRLDDLDAMDANDEAQREETQRMFASTKYNYGDGPSLDEIYEGELEIVARSENETAEQLYGP